MKYRKKPVVIEAIQYNGMNGQEIVDFTEGSGRALKVNGVDFIEINTLEGFIYADIKDFVIKGVKGEFYPCKPDIFEMTYEPVVDCTLKHDGNVHTMPDYGAPHTETSDCWCEPELIDDFTSSGGVKHFLHKEHQ